MLPEERMEKRFPFMSALYSLSDGDVHQDVKFSSIIQEAEMTELEGNQVGKDRFDAGYIWQPFGKMQLFLTSRPVNTREEGRAEWNKKAPVRLTRPGKFEFEKEYMKRKQRNDNNQPNVNNYYFRDNAIVNTHISDSSVQQGKNSIQSLSVTQINNLNEILEELKLVAAGESLTLDLKEELKAEINAIEKNAKSANPDKGIIKGRLGTVLSILGKLEPFIMNPAEIARINNWISSLHF